jgi:2-polyprenyl-6-methoxyphenol hydroxylase-like FAD-dependent oxidoreductase
MPPETQTTTCIVAGGGPAGMMLSLLLARAGVEVTVMEKHADFLRDFRGDTVHASTLRLLDELGLAEDFTRLPHREIETLAMTVQGTRVGIDLHRIPGPHKHIALVPQWDFLELLAAAAEEGADVSVAAQHRGARPDHSRRRAERHSDRRPLPRCVGARPARCMRRSRWPAMAARRRCALRWD